LSQSLKYEQSQKSQKPDSKSKQKTSLAKSLVKEPYAVPTEVKKEPFVHPYSDPWTTDKISYEGNWKSAVFTKVNCIDDLAKNITNLTI
jgi:hypothetical protein